MTLTRCVIDGSSTSILVLVWRLQGRVVGGVWGKASKDASVPKKTGKNIRINIGSEDLVLSGQVAYRVLGKIDDVLINCIS